MVLVFEHTLHTSPCKSQSTDVVTCALAMSDLPIMAIIKIVAQKVKWKWSFLMARRWGIDGVFANICIRRSGEPPVIHRDERSNFLKADTKTPMVEIAWWFRSTTSRARHHEAPSLVPHHRHGPHPDGVGGCRFSECLHGGSTEGNRTLGRPQRRRKGGQTNNIEVTLELEGNRLSLDVGGWVKTDFSNEFQKNVGKPEGVTCVQLSGIRAQKWPIYP